MDYTCVLIQFIMHALHWSMSKFYPWVNNKDDLQQRTCSFYVRRTCGAQQTEVCVCVCRGEQTSLLDSRPEAAWSDVMLGGFLSTLLQGLHSMTPHLCQRR